MTRQTLLLSIRRKHAHAILNGEKEYELRRVRPRVGPGDCVILYVTSPVSAICGCFEVESVLGGSPTQIWQHVQGAVGMTRREVFDYLAGAKAPCALKVCRVQRLNEPVAIAIISQQWAAFRPPQSYRYVPYETAQRLGLIANTAASSGAALGTRRVEESRRRVIQQAIR